MANLLQKASIVLTPTAYDEGKVLCAKPSEPPYGDFDFSRNSAATRVNAQGLVENVQILSSNLVQNGSFSEEGVQEVSNGSFSQEGVELVTNGDFSASTGWQGLNADKVISDGKLNISQASGFTVVYQPETLIVGTYYKCVVEVSNYVDGSFKIGLAGSDAANTSPSINADGTFTFYLQRLSGGSNNVGFVFSGLANLSIDNVSVREVGQDWNLNGWEIAENKATCDASGGAITMTQSAILTPGKTYKITYTILDYVQGVLRFRSSPVSGDYTSGNGEHTVYVTAQNATFGLQGLNGFIGSITNISAKEVGQNWDILNDVTSFSFNNGIANIQGTANSANNGIKQASISAVIGKTYKISATLRSNDGGLYRFRLLDGSYFDLGNGNSAEFETITSYHTATSTAFTIFATSWFTNGTSNFDITNISVIEITDDTNLPRINYEGFSYQDALGSELVTNGDFATDSDWVKGTGWSISGGTANCDGTQTSLSFLIQNGQVQSGKTYKVTYDVTSYTSGEIIAFIGGSQGQTITSVGTYTEYLTTSNTNFWLRANSDFIGSIDNVSVKEYLGQEVVPDSGCGHWLWEPQSTNLIPYSEDFSQGWSTGITGVSFSNTKTISPDGKISADVIIEDNSNNNHRIQSVLSVNTGSVYTFSIFVKPVSGERSFFVTSTPFEIRAYFDLQNGVVISELNGSASMEKIGDYYRCIIVGDATTATGSHAFRIGMADGTTEFYQGDGASSIAVWGAQLEEQTYATSYIPTSGSTVTRNQDVCNNGGSLASINSPEGVLYAEIAALADDTTDNRISLSYNYQNYVRIEISNLQIRFAVFNNGAYQANGNYPVSNITDFNKVAVKYKENDFALWVNGTEVRTDTSGLTSFAAPLDHINFSSANGNNQLFKGKTKALAVFPYLSDEELTLLTAPAPVAPTFTLDFDTIATDFTFARGSEATYVDAQGLIQSTNEIGPELVTNGSFDTDTDWIKGSGATIGGGKANLDGSLSSSYADVLRQVSILTVGKTYKFTYTVSDYVSGGAKFFGNNSVEFSANGTYTEYITATIPNVSLQDRAIPITCSIDNVSVKEYITATNTPRIDYSTGAEAFLLEPQSTNLITYSEDFSDSSWFKGNTSVIANQELSPSGIQDADKVTFLAVPNANIQLTSAIATTIGEDYTYSIYAKADTNVNNVKFGGGIGGDVDLAITDSWQRFSVTFTATSTTTITTLVTRDAALSNIYLWGAQVEQQSYATSYIPTSGTTVTRVGETCVNATPEINSEEGVLYAEISALADDGTNRFIIMNDSTNNNRLTFRYRPSNSMSMEVHIGGVLKFTLAFNYDITLTQKIALKYKESDYAFWVNGVEVGTNTLAEIWSANTLNNIDFDGFGQPFFGNTKDLQIFNEALSDYQLAQLTTI